MRLPIDGNGTPDTNTITLNSNSNTALITGPNSGTIDGTIFTNISDINLAAGNDIAVLSAIGSLTGTLDGGEGTVDDLTVNAQDNILHLDQVIATTSISTTGNAQATHCWLVNHLNDGSDVDLSFSTINTSAAKNNLLIDGGGDNDILKLTLSREEVENLQVTGQLNVLKNYAQSLKVGQFLLAFKTRR